jgi:hypothetical protein
MTEDETSYMERFIALISIFWQQHDQGSTTKAWQGCRPLGTLCRAMAWLEKAQCEQMDA